VLLVVTDRRVLFAAVPDESVGTGTISFSYNDLLTVETGGEEGRRLELTTESGSHWQYQFPPDETESVGTTRRHLSWVGEIRRRVVGTRGDIEFAAGEIRDHARERKWTAGEERYEQTRRPLDRLIGAVQRTEPIDDEVLAPELTDMERTLEEAAARLYIERAESHLELGRQLVGTENYGQARKVLSQAQTYYETATGHSDTVRRGDAFQFGEQRDLLEALDRISWELDTVVAEPIRQAHEAKIQAQKADDPETAVEHWESAFRRYGQVLTINWDVDSNRTWDDSVEVYEELEAAAEALVSLRSRLAQVCWEEGVASRRDGKPKAALQSCGEARDHLERAHELAAEFDIGDADGIATRLQGMREMLTEVPETATLRGESARDERVTPESRGTVGAHEEAGSSAEVSLAEPAGDRAVADIDRGLPSAAELREVGTRQ